MSDKPVPRFASEDDWDDMNDDAAPSSRLYKTSSRSTPPRAADANPSGSGNNTDNNRDTNTERDHNGYAPIAAAPEEAFLRLQDVADAMGGAFEEPEIYRDSVARTMFDTPQSKDDTLTLVLPANNIARLPTQSLVRIKSGDGRTYLGVIIEGPFAEPDGLRGDSPIVVTVTVAGSIFMPRYHGRVGVTLLGEETEDGLVPPRFRPLPNSPAFPLSEAETGETLKVSPAEHPLRLGLAVGHEHLPVCIPAHAKSLFPRHLAVLGTTGGGKTTTVSGMIGKQQQAGLAVTLIDTEGEYTHINEPTEDATMQKLLQKHGLNPACVENTVLYHLVGKETSNDSHPRRREFCLKFDSLSPYLVVEILDMSEAQQQRFLFAYDIAKRILAAVGGAAEPLEIDEMEQGYPGMMVAHVSDIIDICTRLSNKSAAKPAGKKDAEAAGDSSAQEDYHFSAPDFASRQTDILNAIRGADMPGNFISWQALKSKLGRLKRLNIFDRAGSSVKPLTFAELTTPGQVSIIDLSGTDSPQVNNLAIAELLRGIYEQQEANFKAYEQKEKQTLTRSVVIIEEAHEFLSRERIKQMPVLFQQVARIARRGRKRWLGLVFVTQLPQHLPDEVLGLVNSFILHKISDSGVIDRLKKTIGSIDASLWGRLPNLAPGQAIVSMTSLTRPLLVAMDPTPCKLRMTEDN